MATEVNHCKCGSYDEWETCDSKGVYMEPSINWNGHYRCMNCNNVEQLVNEKEIKEGEYDEANIFVEDLSTRYLNEEDFYISDHIEDIKEHLEANPKYDSVAEVVSHLDIDLPGFPGDEIFEKAEALIAEEIKKIKRD